LITLVYGRPAWTDGQHWEVFIGQHWGKYSSTQKLWKALASGTKQEEEEEEQQQQQQQQRR